MKAKVPALLAAVSLTLALAAHAAADPPRGAIASRGQPSAVPVAGHPGEHGGGWHGGGGSHSGIGHIEQWHGGQWYRGDHDGRFGSWWVIGPSWYWYPNEVYPLPDPYTPPGLAAGLWYWCPDSRQYYPYAGDLCPSGWVPVTPQYQPNG